MQSPVSMQVEAQRRDASGPSPVRRMSMTPETTSCAGALTPAGVLTGQTSTHFPQRVQASTISWMRPFNASSKKLLMEHGLISIDLERSRLGLPCRCHRLPPIKSGECDDRQKGDRVLPDMLLVYAGLALVQGSQET